MIVMKFGGTSVKDEAAISRVIGIVRGRLAEKPLVVVSAMSKVTRNLCSLGEAAAAGNEAEVSMILKELRERHFGTAAELIPVVNVDARKIGDGKPGETDVPS